MSNKKVLLFSAFAMSLGLVSCVNEDYDLSNLDTTIGVKVKDLTLAMNLTEDIKLDKVMDLEDGSQIKKLTDPSTGDVVYAVLEDGDFKSDPITINGFSAESPEIKPITDELPMKQLNKQVFDNLTNEIKKETNKRIDAERDRLTKEYQDNYKVEKENALKDAVNEAIETAYKEAVKEAESKLPAGMSLTDAQKKEIKDEVTAEVNSKISTEIEPKVINEAGKIISGDKNFKGTTDKEVNDMIAKMVSAEVEAKRQSIVDETAADPKVRKDAQEIAWANIKDDEVFAKYEISNAKTDISASSDNVDKALRSLSYVHASSTINLSLQLSNLTDVIEVIIKGAKAQMPVGLDMTCVDAKGNKKNYDPATGILDLGDVNLTQSKGKYDLTITINGFDVNKGGIKFTPKKNAAGSFAFENEVKIISGDVNITKKDFINGNTIFDLPEEAIYACNIKMTDIVVNAIDGSIEYTIDKPNIDPVDINDLPDLLTDEKTNILLGNPQIYLSVSNPLYSDKVGAQMGLQLTAVRPGKKDVVCALDDKYIELKKDKNETVYCLSPEKPKKMYTGYEDAEFKGYKSVKNILAGEGLPSKILVDVIDPMIPQQEVKNFGLGRDLDPVKGDYTLYAPLNLSDGSVVEYRDTIDGWNDETFEKLNVTELNLDAVISSTLPLGASLNMIAIDVNGKEIKGIECSSFKLQANTQNQNVNLKLTSTVGLKNLDGIILRATVIAEGAEATLAPTQNISISKAKITVSGSYTEPDED